MDLHPTFVLYLINFLRAFLAYKEHGLFQCKVESFWAGRIFSPRLIKKFIVELFGHVGFFSGNLVFFLSCRLSRHRRLTI